MTPKFVFAINYTADTNQLLTEPSVAFCFGRI
jgi:hypothetical protein